MPPTNRILTHCDVFFEFFEGVILDVIHPFAV